MSVFISDQTFARLQAWVVKLLWLAVEAHAPETAEVVGFGLSLTVDHETLHPHSAVIHRNTGQVMLAVFIWRQPDESHRRAQHRARLARAGVLEYWELESDGKAHKLYQLNARGGYDLIPPDAEGMYYAAAIEAFHFPAAWLDTQPTLLEMMQAWGLIEEGE